MEHSNEHPIVGTNPIFAIGVAIGIAAIMVLATFLIFINSDSYKTVKQIEAGTAIAKSLQSNDIDTRSPIKADDITTYQQSVETRLKTLDDSSDFGDQALSDQALGIVN